MMIDFRKELYLLLPFCVGSARKEGLTERTFKCQKMNRVNHVHAIYYFARYFEQLKPSLHAYDSFVYTRLVISVIKLVGINQCHSIISE